MIKIYTHEAYMRLIGSYPCLYMEDDGLLYSEENYHKLVGCFPCGKVDLASGKVYGSDYSSMFCSPVAEFTRAGDEIRVYKSPRGTFDSPWLYVKGDQIFSAEEYYKTFGRTPCGHIVAVPDSPKKPQTDGGSTGGRTGGSSGGGGAGCGLPLWGLALAALVIWALVKFGIFLITDMTGLLGFFVSCAFPILTAKLGPLKHLEKDPVAVAQCKAKANNTAVPVAVVCGALWGLNTYDFYTKSGARTDVLLLLLAMSVGFTAASFFFAREYFYRKALLACGGKATPTAGAGPVPTQKPKPASWLTPVDGTGSGKTIVRCPRCRVQCRVSVGKGKRTVVCPNSMCRKPFDIDV